MCPLYYHTKFQYGYGYSHIDIGYLDMCLPISTTRKQAKGPGQRYQLLLQPVTAAGTDATHQYRLQQQLVPLASGAQRQKVWYRVKALTSAKTQI